VETIFHRIIPGFVVQGGGLTADMREKEGQHAPIINESANKVRNARGSISMARTSDPNSATSQFFINLSQNAPLDYDESTKRPGYAVFGRVISGMDVVDKMAKVRTGNKGYHQDVPLEPIKVLKVSCR
jgi:cyclophilin family peptidyl-prolyl cis-trans isomerase